MSDLTTSPLRAASIRLLGLGLATVVLAGGATSGAAAGPFAAGPADRAAGRPAAATGVPAPEHAAAAARAFGIDLYRRGDAVSQARADWCVPAAILTMMNMIDRDRTLPRPSQAALDRLARRLSTDRLVGAGSEPEGWAGALNEHGFGPYVVVQVRTRKEAIATAARALRLTGRPVGLLVWRGAHAWVMSGFEATADPARSDDYSVTHVRVTDPWYPRSSSIWGRSRPPDTRVAVRDLTRAFLPWRRPTVRYAEKDGRFVLVLPIAPRPAVGPVSASRGTAAISL